MGNYNRNIACITGPPNYRGGPIMDGYPENTIIISIVSTVFVYTSGVMADLETLSLKH